MGLVLNLLNAMNTVQQNLITILGLEDLPDQEKFEIVDHATTVVLKRAYLRIVDSLSDEDRARVEEATIRSEQEGSQALVDTIGEIAPDRIQLLIEEEATKLKEELKAQADHVRSQMQTAEASS